jgi:hypothetical protein
MYSLNINPVLLLQKRGWRRITPPVLDSARESATRILQSARASGYAAFENQMGSVLFGGAMPLLSHILFGWPAYLVMLGIAADNTALWTTDFLKRLFARGEFDVEWERQREVAETAAVALAVTAHPRRTDRTGRLIYRELEPSTSAIDGFGQLGMLIALLPLSWGSLFYPDKASEDARTRTFIMIAIPVAIRATLAVVAVVRRSQSGLPNLSLMPQAPRQLLAFLAAALIFVCGSLLVENEHNGLGRYDGIAFFSIYLICMAISALGSLGSMRRAQRALQTFAAMDIESLKERITKIH